MTRDEKVSLINKVANRPEILAACAPGYGGLDLTPFVEYAHNIVIGDERGLVLFEYKGNAVYGMHYLLTDAMRGPDALRAIKDAMTTLFTQHQAHAIVGQTPRDNRPARAMNRALGGHPYGVSVDSQGRHCIDYVLERETWLLSLGLQ